MSKPWERQEKRLEQNLQAVGEARGTIASGRFWHSKGDVQVRNLLRVEAKTSGKQDTKGRKSITVKKEWLEKVEREALRAGRGELPVLAISFDESKDYFVIEDYHFINLLTELVQLREELEGAAD